MDQELFSNIDVAKHNGILRLFIGFAQMKNLYKVEESSEEDCITVLNWLSSNKIDLNQETWYKTKDGNLIPQLQGDMGENNFLSWIFELKSMLPILLKCNGNVKFVNETGKTVLHFFIEDYLEISQFRRERRKIHQMVEYLMDRGIPMQATDKNGNTPMHTAAKFGIINLIPIMLKNCIDINACNNQGDTVLHMLCYAYTYFCQPRLVEQCVQLMLLKGADMNIQNKVGWTPVHVAAKCIYLGVLNVVLKRGANLNLLTNDGENPLLVCCKYAGNQIKVSLTDSTFNLIKYIELLVNKGCNVSERNRDGYSSLHYTCMDQEVPASNKLIEAGADVHCRTKDFLLTPLHCAAYRSSVLLLKPLVEAGAEVNAKTADGVTPLHLTGLSGRLDAAEYLIGEGADISCRESIFGFTALHMAALGGNSPDNQMNLEYFLEQGLDVNDGGNYGITALHLASFGGNVEYMELLISRGADVQCRDNVTRSTALHFAAQQGTILDSISLMGNAELKPCWENDPVFFRSRSTVARLVESGVGVNEKDAYGRTPLHLATMYAGRQKCRGLDPIIAMDFEDLHPIVGLMSCGPHMDVQDDEGNVPVHNALKTEHEKALEVLLKFGVDVNDADTSRIVLNSKAHIKNKVFEYLVILRAAELPVSNAYNLHANGPEFQSLYNQCLDEVENMSIFFIDDTIPMYDLLHIGWRRRSNFAQKLPADLQKKFPLYAGIIQGSCREAEQRKSLLEPAKWGWYRITKVDLLDICVERILAHLKNRYLRVLAEGLSEDGS